MRTAAQKIFAVLLLAVCLGAPLAETLDQWDRTAQDGNDTELNLLIAAVCVGIGLVAAAATRDRIRPPVQQTAMLRPLGCSALADLCAITPAGSNSPPSVLRI